MRRGVPTSPTPHRRRLRCLLVNGSRSDPADLGRPLDAPCDRFVPAGAACYSFEPSRHPNPDTRPACRDSACRIAASLPATCSSLRARVMAV